MNSFEKYEKFWQVWYLNTVIHQKYEQVWRELDCKTFQYAGQVNDVIKYGGWWKVKFLKEFLISANVPAIGLGDGLHEASYVYKDVFWSIVLIKFVFE